MSAVHPVYAFVACILALAGTTGTVVARSAGATMQPAGEAPEPVMQPVVPPGLGEPEPPGPEQLAAPRPTVFELRVRSELGFSGDLRDEPGDVTIVRLGAGVGVAIPVRQYARLDVGLEYEYSNYAFSGATGFAPGFDSPWEDIHRETLSLRFSQQISARLSAFFGGTAGFSHEDGASLSDSLVLSGFSGVRYGLTEDVSISFGAVMVSQLEDGPLIYPLLGVDIALTDQLRLTNGGRLGLMLAYDAGSDLTFSLGGSYERREFRLRDDGPAPGGVGRDQRVPVAAGVAYRPTPRLSIEALGGAYLWQSYRLADSDNNTMADIDARPTPFMSLQVGYRF
jgi:hypothetical protein